MGYSLDQLFWYLSLLQFFSGFLPVWLLLKMSGRLAARFSLLRIYCRDYPHTLPLSALLWTLAQLYGSLTQRVYAESLRSLLATDFSALLVSTLGAGCVLVYLFHKRHLYMHLLFAMGLLLLLLLSERQYRLAGTSMSDWKEWGDSVLRSTGWFALLGGVITGGSVFRRFMEKRPS
jgi:hypothetical protein